MRGKCKSCQFYKGYNFKATARSGGVCHRFPKVERVTETHWCGERVAKQKLKPVEK